MMLKKLRVKDEMSMMNSNRINDIDDDDDDDG